MPTLTDLRSGELAYTSMALSFRLFGLHDWSGRLPLVLWGLLGAMSVYTLVARLVDRRAGLFATVALVTMPLYFLHARTMLGDIVTMAALAMALSGLGGAMWDRGTAVRAGWTALGITGLFAGYLSRGMMIGVAIPALSAGLAAVVLEAGTGSGKFGPKRDVYTILTAGLSLVLGIVSLVLGLQVLGRAMPGGVLLRHLGFEVLSRAPNDATFDLPLRDLGHALFPWSAFLPFAFGKMFRSPTFEGDSEQAEPFRREAALRVFMVVALGVAFGVYAMLGPRTGALPFSGPMIFAVIVALALRDFERGAPPSRAVTVAVPLLGFVLYTDMKRFPDKALAAFAIEKAPFPKSFEAQGEHILLWALALFAGLTALAWFESQDEEPSLTISEWVEARTTRAAALGRYFAELWAGNLVFVAVVIEAALVGLAAMVFFGRRFGWEPVERLPKLFADVAVNLWWAVPCGIGGMVVLLVLARDVYRWVTRGLRVHRAIGVMFGAVLAGGVLSFGYYPALADQLSPKEAFETLATLAKPGEEVAMLGVRSRAAAYYGSGKVTTLGDPLRAFQWLTEEGDESAKRKWLFFRAEDLPKLNSLYRRHTGKNLPVLDGRSSQILLASNRGEDSPNQNPLASMVLDTPPNPARKVEASFRGELTVLGWEVADESGAVVESVVPQRPYHLRFYYRVESPLSGNWKAFVHIDGFGRRYNGDHSVLDGRYAMNLWNPGDVVVDDLVFQLEPNFLPGQYTVFFGFFVGETRYAVTRGPSQDNRVVGGPINVR
ncbi:MAG: glycosyltransferase family 39 protein [Polyangiaceae bacterium]|nr:glycosyltransferase family 39 protein [Polyangiaceae bacterium]